MRVSNWPHALAEYLREAQTRPFEWAVHDCVQFAAGAVAAVTGVRPAVPAYANHGAARRLLAEASLAEWVTAVLGPELPPPLARRGDLVLIETDSGPTLGVVTGVQALFPGKPVGLIARPVLDSRCAWRVD